MKRAGLIVLTPFPYTDLSGTKLRPVLMLRQASRFGLSRSVPVEGHTVAIRYMQQIDTKGNRIKKQGPSFRFTEAS